MSRTDRINELKSAVKEWVDEEQKKIDKEVTFLEKLLETRPGGKGVQSASKAPVSKAALNDLKSYLGG